MKIFTNKNIWKKIVVALLIILSFQIIMIKPVEAENESFGGKLLSPILSLLVGLGDGLNDMVSRAIMGSNSTLYEIEMMSSFGEKILTAIVAIAAAAIAILVIIATAGLAAVALAAVGITATVTVGIGTIVAGVTTGIVAGVWFNDEVLPDNIYLPMYTYSAEEMFKGNILLFDVNYFKEAETIYAKTEKGDIINLDDYSSRGEAEDDLNQNYEGVKYYFYYDEDNLDEHGNPREIKTSNQNSAVILKKTVSSWYNALRDICLVVMLSVLVYIGIRILLSSVASDKAKYLTMLKDWFVGLCLLFLIHYIMAFSVTLVEKLTDIVKTSVDENAYTVVMQTTDKLEKGVEELGLSGDGVAPEDDIIQETDGVKYLTWPTNLMGSLRLQLQMETYGAQFVGLSLCFFMLCLFTLYFTVIYMKRVLHMAFLTLIAPMVALTYCIDKLNDGKAQGFDKWFKEYIFNLLIQPMHLLLYYILVTSAFELASTNVVYSIIAIGFMLPAEKLLRSLFGFEKAQTAPTMGPAGAMMASTALNSLLNNGKSKKDQKKGGGNGGSSDDDSSGGAPNPVDRNPMDAYQAQTSEQPQLSENGDDSAPQAQLDTYDEQFGGEDWDPQEREAMAREAAGDEGAMQYSNDELENIARETLGEGASDEEVADFLKENYGIEPPSQQQNQQQNQQPTQTSQQTSKLPQTRLGRMKRRIKRMGSASLAAQKAAMRSFPRTLKRNIENSHPIRAMGKVAAGVGTAAAAGAVGLAIGATTGDLSNVNKIGLGAAAGGYALGFGRVPKSIMENENAKAAYNNTYNKGEYKPDAMEDYIKNYLKDPQNQNYFERKFDSKTAKEMMKRGGVIEQCLNNDITDKKEIAAAYKLQQEGVVRNIEEAISVAQLSQMVNGNTNNMTSKTRNEWKARFSDMAGESGIKESDRAVFAENRLKEIDKFYDFKK